MHYEVNATTGEALPPRSHTLEELAELAKSQDSLGTIKAEGIDQAREILELRRGVLVSLRPGQKTEEEFKREEGQAWAAEFKPDPPAPGKYPIAEAEAKEEQVTVAERLQSYLDAEAGIKVAMAEIAGLERKAIGEIENAISEEEISDIIEALQ